MSTSKLRILFLENHPMWIYGLPNGFRKLGHAVKTCLPQSMTRSAIDRFKPDLIIAIGWTPSNDRPKKQERIAALVQYARVPYIYWSTEDPGYTRRLSLPLIARTKPDFVFSIHRPTVERFQQLGIRAAHLDFGSDSSVHRRLKPLQKYKGAAALVANGYSRLYRKNPRNYRFQSLRRLVNPFLSSGIKTDLYGQSWKTMKRIFRKPIPASRIHDYLPYQDASKVYSSVDYVLGPQNATDRLTQRTYEILASGGLLITDDTPEVRKWFVPGRDLLVTSSEEETARLMAYYNKRPELREQIRANAVIAAAAHSYTVRADYMLRKLSEEKILNYKSDLVEPR
ncbi:glycosyltransferase [Paenibacillus glycanilyticus]|uniref:CgeB family protein n=1 Tax=Paenibacillus glycanilyticus TaxID=126569 RepID=UPI0020416772|nr:glycosyltransferase [Paenibacillus glycanilyticus]MCM3627596.1 glycosyltransferase [Paenibacillus glycanilyticus]